MVVGVRVACVGAVGVGLVIISHISDHFVMRVVGVMVRVMVKQFKERVKSAKRKDLDFHIFEAFKTKNINISHVALKDYQRGYIDIV